MAWRFGVGAVVALLIRRHVCLLRFYRDAPFLVLLSFRWRRRRCEAPESGPQTAKRTSAMAGLVARFLPVVEAFFVANARDPKGAEVGVFVFFLLRVVCCGLSVTCGYCSGAGLSRFFPQSA